MKRSDAGRLRSRALYAPARFLLVIALAASRLAGAQDLRALDSVVPSLMREHDVPGVALAIVRGDSVLALKGYGFARLRDRTLVDPERTIFRLASVAKLFVATAVMQQAESGRVDLHTDINRYLSWRIPATFPEPVTLDRLLTHTSGFDERLIGYAAPTADAIGALGEHLAGNFPRRGWPPGAVSGYSNYGFALAAHVVERASGLPFDRYARDRLFAPLGMARTSYIRVPDSLANDLADGHFCAQSRCVTAPVINSRPYPVGLAYSTARDMARFMRAQLGGGAADRGRILAPASVATMQRQHSTADSAVPGMSYAFFNQRKVGHAVLSHAGNVPGFNNLLLLVPAERLGIYFVANGGRTTFGRALRDSLLGMLVSPAPISRPAPMMLSESYVRSLSGNYQLARYAHHTIEAFPSLFTTAARVRAEGSRLVLAYPMGALQFEPIDSLRFREVGGERMLAFRRDGAGRVTHLAVPVPVFGADLPGVLERRAWHEGARFMNEYVSWLAMGPPIILVVLWIAAAVSWWRAPAAAADAPRPARDRLELYVVWGAIAFVPLWLLFAIRFIARSVRMLENATGLIYGVPADMRAMAAIPWVLAALTAVVVVGAGVAWRRRWWDVFRRALLSAFALGAVLVVAFLVRWNYLPVVF